MARRHQPVLLDQLDEVLALDGQTRELGSKRDTIRAEVNELSKQVGRLRRDGNVAAAEELQARSRSLGDDERVVADELDEVQAALRELLLRIPNVPHPDAPDGRSDADNPVVVGPVNLPESFAEHQRVPHWETAAALGILDNERAV